jgi:hypothetical protein
VRRKVGGAGWGVSQRGCRRGDFSSDATFSSGWAHVLEATLRADATKSSSVVVDRVSTLQFGDGGRSAHRPYR